MDGEAEQVGAEVADAVASAIDAANEHAEHTNAVANAILDGAVQTEQARQVRSLEEDVSECLSNQAALSEAMTGMALRLEEVSGALSTLQALVPSMISPPVIAPSAPEDGPRESLEPEATVIAAPVAETVEAPKEPEKPARKKKRWI